MKIPSSVVTAITVIAALLMTVSCHELKQSGRRPAVQLVENIISEKGRDWSLVSGFDAKESRGSIAIVGTKERNERLAQAFLHGDDFDNIDGSSNPDGLPDFAGEQLDVITDLAGSPYGAIAGTDSLRTMTVRNFIFALDTLCSIGAFDNEKLQVKENAKTVIFTSPFCAESGAFDIDTLCRVAGSPVPVIFPSRLVFSAQLDRGLEHPCIAVLTDSATAVSGVYPRIFEALAKERGALGATCVAFYGDSLSTMGDVLARYRRTGGMMPLSALVLDDPGTSYDELLLSLARVMGFQNEENLNYRKLMTKDFEIIDMQGMVTGECYRILRNNNIFTHNIAYPVSKEYITVTSTDGSGINLVEQY